MSEYRRRLLDRLLLEVDRAERWIALAAEREGDVAGEHEPGDALRAIASHARASARLLAPLLPPRAPARTAVALAAALGALRRLVLLRVFDGERAYRAMLGDLHRELDLVHLLHAVAAREDLPGVTAWCDAWLTLRAPMLARAELALAWFADDPRLALHVRAALRAS
ncbi:MAG TPA: hypothetical protein VL463_23815 [Kofleriaceae bacterium]|jgi:hypothetical protein|nr:hypothetical protein [Kofleriaceae bacterium]